MDHISRGIRRERRNPNCRSYDFMYLVKLVQTFSKIYVFYKVKGHVITKCPQIDKEVRDGSIRHVG